MWFAPARPRIFAPTSLATSLLFCYVKPSPASLVWEKSSSGGAHLREIERTHEAMHTSRLKSLETHAFVKKKRNRIVRPSHGFSHDRRNETAATAPGCAYSPPAASPTIGLDPLFCTYRVAGRPAELPSLRRKTEKDARHSSSPRFSSNLSLLILKVLVYSDSMFKR